MWPFFLANSSVNRQSVLLMMHIRNPAAVSAILYMHVLGCLMVQNDRNENHHWYLNAK